MPTLKKILKILNRALDALVDWASVIFLTALMAVLAFQVFSRFLNIKTTWTEELAQLLFVYTVFLALPLAAKNGQLIYIKAVAGFWPEKIKPKIDIISQLIWLLFLLGFMAVCLKNMAGLYQFKSVTPVLRLSETLVTGVLPISFFLTFRQGLITLGDSLKK